MEIISSVNMIIKWFSGFSTSYFNLFRDLFGIAMMHEFQYTCYTSKIIPENFSKEVKVIHNIILFSLLLFV